MSGAFTMKQDIIKRAEADLEFRKELKKDPKGAIEKYFPQKDKKKIPQKMNIVVVEDSEHTVYVNIAPEDYHLDSW